MQKISNVVELRSAIQTLENEQAINGMLLKEQLYCIYESLRPISFIHKLLGLTSSGNILGTIVGSILKFAVSNAVSKKSNFLKSIGQFVFEYLFRAKENK